MWELSDGGKNLNYGVTYYALNQVITRFGKSVVMIEKGCNDTKNKVAQAVPHVFADKYYSISPRCGYSDVLTGAPHIPALQPLGR